MDSDTTDAAWFQFEQEQHQREVEQMKTSDMIQSKFLKKDDFPQPVVLTIKGVSLEEVGRGEERWVLFFNERSKGIVLNVTKIKQLEATYGDDSDRWIGKKVKVLHDPTVMMGTQVVGGIKFVMPSAAQQAAAPAPVAPVAATATADAFDDEIPF